MEDRLGRLVADRLRVRADVDAVTGIATGGARDGAGIEVVTLGRDYDGIADVVRQRGIDTIVHADRPWAPSPRGRHRFVQHVIATMRLAAAAGHRTSVVRSVVMASSTRVYAVSSREARLHPETEALRPRPGSMAAALLEAEGYVRDLATTNPNLSASIVRLADLAGPGLHEPLPTLLASPVVPAVWGFDPAVQLLHLDDAVAALEHAADHDLAGVYNAGAPQLVRWRTAIRLARRPRLDLPAASTRALTRLLQLTYRITADDLVNELKYGRAAATDALARAGFQPTTTSTQCIQLPSDPEPDAPG